MALDIANKDYSPGQIQISVWDETDNALRVTTVGDSANSVPVTQVQMLDDGNQTPFLRNFIYDAVGAVDSFVDTDLDGAPYVLVGNAVLLEETLTNSVVTTTNELILNNYSSSGVDTLTYLELVAATSEDIKELEIFDSSGQILVLALGAAASEVDLMYITPGGNGTVVQNIPAGSRISIKAISADATTGYLVINCKA